MVLPATADPIPLRADADGTVRVGGTRVTLDSVVGAFRDGASAESIAERFPSLALPDVYTVIGFYLSHRNEVDAYLAQRAREADDLQRQAEAKFDPAGIRARLLARGQGVERQA